MRIGLVSAVHGRPAVVKIGLAGWARLAEIPSISLRGAVTGPENDASRGAIEGAGWTYLVTPNTPLGWRYNLATAMLRGSVDAVMVFGSDDLICDGYMKFAAEALSNGHDYLGVSDLYLYDLDRKAMGYWPGYDKADPILGHRHGEPIGLGRVFSKRLLDMIKWEPWEHKINRGLDRCTTARLARLAEREKIRKLIINHRDSNFCVLDLKSANLNICSFSSLDPQKVEKPDQFIRAHFSGREVALMESYVAEPAPAREVHSY